MPFAHSSHRGEEMTAILRKKVYLVYGGKKTSGELYDYFPFLASGPFGTGLGLMGSAGRGQVIIRQRNVMLL